jgi:zinc transport system substrate-binding protein
MINRLPVVAVSLLLGIVPLTGCRQTQMPSPTSDKVQIAVSIAPQKYFVERIGDGYVTANVMVPPGAEPHTFEPKPEQLKALSRANAYMRIRIDFEEAWMGKIEAANPKMLVVDTTQSIQRMPMEEAFHEEEEQRAGEGENLDPHIWLSPKLVKIQAQTICDTLVKLDPKHQAAYRANLKSFLSDIDKLDADIRNSLQGVKNRKFIVFHPGWGYFARDYGLKQIPIEVGGQEPSAAELGAIITEAKKENIQIVFAEPQFSKQAAETIAKEIGGEVLLIDPLTADWKNNLRSVANTFAKVLSQRHSIYLQVRAIIPCQSPPCWKTLPQANTKKTNARSRNYGQTT